MLICDPWELPTAIEFVPFGNMTRRPAAWSIADAVVPAGDEFNSRWRRHRKHAPTNRSTL